VEGDGISVAERLAEQYGGRMRSHKRFGTAKWILPPAKRDASGTSASPSALAHDMGDAQHTYLPGSLDFVTARTEFYSEPTALPTVERSSIKLDLHRRDFTINTLAICLSPDRWGELIDFYGGERDLQEGLIRVLHTHSFVDDPTRILRAVRFEQRFGFKIEARTAELIADSVDLLERITPARVRHELELIFAESRPEQALRRLDQFGVTAYIHRDLRSDPWVASRFEALRADLPADPANLPAHLDQLYFALWTYRLKPDAIPELDVRLNLMRSTVTLLENLHQAKRHIDELEGPDLKRSRICHLLQPTLQATRLLLPIATASEVVRSHVALYEQELRFIRPRTDGRDLKKMGLAPGPVYRDILDTVRDALLDGTLSSKEEERTLVTRLVREHLDPAVHAISV
jgi:tRNA nucleotidyltransferase (CCA-adding enzyme)